MAGVKPDISVIVTAHREGRLAHPTMSSVWNAVRRAEQDGIVCEVLVMLDRPDDCTRNYYRTHQPRVRLYEVDHGDPGPGRNRGAEHARGKYLSYLDGDDLYSPNWLRLAYIQAEATARPTVFNARYTVAFDQLQLIIRHHGTDEPGYYLENLAVYNPWIPAFFARRDIVLTHPFIPCPRGGGFGYEDWHWYCEIVADNIPVSTVDRTTWYYRRRSGSRLNEHDTNYTIIHPARILDPATLIARLNASQENAKTQESAPPPATAPLALGGPESFKSGC